METDPGDRKALLKKALLALDEMETRLAEAERRRYEPVAVIGIGCRFPGGADSPDAYWRLIRSGGDAVRAAPGDRWDVDEISRSAPDVKVTWKGGFLDGIDQFDPAFFGISPREANNMDPQQRLVLETAWQALENGAIVPASLANKPVGVFMGVTTNDYAQILKSGSLANLDAYAATGGALNAVAGRLAYVLGLQGPCMTVDTACSSSLVAIHLAIRSLRAGECSMALAGGVNAVLTPEAFVAFARWGMMAPDGHCKAFDASADGFVRGEGCGMLALKPLADAQRDGDMIWAVLRGSAVNQDGRSSGLTVPNGLAQQRVIRSALADAGAQPAQIDFVEAHGTGTDLGDPIEVEAMGAVLGEKRPPDRPLVIGSVKTNLGHLESASGIAGLIKTILALKNEEIPPNLHFKTRSPKIPWPDFPVEVPVAVRAWPRRVDRPRLAGVSSFGFSGTNAHVVVEEAPFEPQRKPDAAQADRPALLLFSARSDAALRALARRHAENLQGLSNGDLGDMAYTLSTGRTQFLHRAALAVTDAGTAGSELESFAAGESSGLVRAGIARRKENLRIAMIFTGQGAQYTSMAHRLYQTEAVFRDALNRCAAILDQYLEIPLLEVLYPKPGQVSPLDNTAYTQPALFAVEWSLACLWKSWGVEPFAVMGHSVGELAAACVAGVFSLEDGLKLIAARARRMGEQPAGGGMAAVFAPAETVLPALAPFGDRLSVAAFNAPDNTVVSGHIDALESLLQTLEQNLIQSKRLPVSHAFHASLMDPILEPFEVDAASVAYQPPQIHLISNVSGTEAGGEVATAAYWRKHIRKPVKFMDGVKALQALGCNVIIEIGPNPTLTSLARRCVNGAENLAWVPSLRAGQDDLEMLARGLGELFVNGVPFDQTVFSRSSNPHKVNLPTYPFERQRYWVEETGERSGYDPAPAALPKHFLTHPIELADAGGKRIWEGEVSLERFPYLADHRVQDTAVLPATAYLEMAFTAAAQSFGCATLALSEVTNHQVLVLQPRVTRLIQVILDECPGESGAAEFRIFSRPKERVGAPNWLLHVSGRAQIVVKPSETGWNPETIRRACSSEISGKDFYRFMAEQGNDWGPAFQGLEHVWQAPGQALGMVRVSEAIAAQLTDYCIHPALADACGHALLAADPAGLARRGAFVGGGMQAVRLYQPVRGSVFWAHARLHDAGRESDKTLIGDVQLYDSAGELVSETLGARLVYLDVEQTPIDPERTSSANFYLPGWEPITDAAGVELPRGRWLILSDTSGVGDEIARRLRGAGRECTLVYSAGDEPRATEMDCMVHPDSSQEFQRLWEKLLPEKPAVVLHLWALDNALRESTGLLGVKNAQQNGPVSLLHLIKTGEKAQAFGAARLWIVTRGAQNVSGQVSGFAQAMVWGFGRSLSLEHPELWGGLVDIAEPASVSVAAQQILDAICHPEEDQVSYSGEQRYGFRLTPTEPPGVPGEPFACRPDRAYCITGGLGGLGLAAAEWLCQHGARRLILLGRTPLPNEAVWDALPPGGRFERAIAGLRRLKALGAEVTTTAVDVADETTLRTFFDAYDRAGNAPIAGVIHAAGVAQHQSIVETEAEELYLIQRAKVQGAWLLHTLFKDKPLDFFVLYSSASSLLNSPLAACYAAANAFLDGLACYRKAMGLPALSVNWGFWKDVGMVADFAAGREMGESIVGLMRTENALQALERCLAQSQPQMGVFTLDWRLLGGRYTTFAQFPVFSKLNLAVRNHAGAPAQTESSRQFELSSLSELDPDQRRAALERYLVGVVASVLRLKREQVDVAEPISSFGLDSLTALEIKNKVEKDSGVTIPFVRFLQGSSVQELANVFEEKLLNSLPKIEAEKAAAAPEEPVPGKAMIWPLSATQESMWFLHQFAPGNAAYNIAFAARVRSPIDLQALQRVLNQLARRHPALRITVQADRGERIQIVQDDLDVPVEHVWVGGDGTEEITGAAVSIYRRPFDLAVGPVFRAAVISRADDDHLLMLLVHHIACDGWSMGILLRDFAALYGAEVDQASAQLGELPATFGDFVQWQQAMLAAERGERLWEYWRDKLSAAPVCLDLPTDFERPQNQTFNGASLSFKVSEELADRIRSFAQQENTTAYTILLAVYMALLHKLTGQEDILVGTPVSGRNQAQFEAVVGNMINMIVLRVQYNPGESFKHLLGRVRQTVAEALDHQDYPFPTLVQRLSPERLAGRTPVFQVTFDYQRLGRYGDIASLWAPEGEVRSVALNGLNLESFYLPQQEGQFELGLQIAEGAANLFGALKYNSDLYLPETIRQMQNEFINLLEVCVTRPDQALLNEHLIPECETNMNLSDLLAVLRQKDIQLSVDQGRLKVNAPAGAITPELQAELVSHKGAIIELLQSLSEPKRAPLPAVQPGLVHGNAPLSFPQQRLWFLYRFDPQNTAYGISGAVELGGPLDVESLERSISEVIRRHHALRTVFLQNELGQPVQSVQPPMPVAMAVIDLQGSPEDEREAQAARLIYEKVSIPFDLTTGPLYHFYLFKLEPQCHWLFVHIHHIVADGWSINIFFDEMRALYQAYSSGRASPLAELAIQYTDYAVWQRRWYTPELLGANLAYWTKKLARPLPILELPADRPRPAILTDHGADVRAILPAELYQNLVQLCSRLEVTPFMLLLAAYETLLYRYTGQTDILVGAPVANRERTEIEPLIGLFVNTLVLRNDLSGNPSFLDLLHQVKDASLEAFAHQDTPFEMIVEAIHPDRDTSHTPIFQVFFTLQNFRLQNNQMADLEVMPVVLQSKSSKFDLSLTLGDSLLGFVYDIEYNPDLFDVGTIERMMGHYRAILEAVCTVPDLPIDQIPLLTAAEKSLFSQWNATEGAYPQTKTLAELFEAQVDRSPNAAAVCDEAVEISYAELDRRANRLAAYLRAMGVGPETLVGVCLPRDVDMVVCTLAIFKAGGAYVPLDPSYPVERLAYMLEDSAAPVLLTNSGHAGKFRAAGRRVVCIDTDAAEIAACSHARTQCTVTPENLAYVIYTSGSTGKPKGVQVLQRGLVNFLCSMQREPGLSAEDVLVSVTTLSFDIAGLELYLPLISGAKLVVVSTQTAGDGARLKDVLAAQHATIMQATPATWRLLLAAGWQGGSQFRALCGGEALAEDLASELLKRCGSLWNMYGPTETTIWSTLDRVQAGQAITIGRPIANTKIYILDGNGQTLPVGVPGELYIGGEGVARGYLNRPELTQEKFVPDPFSEQPGARMYRTGDLARWRSDGRVEFLGRIDHQVKLRGFRIELGEIENVLGQHLAVRQAVVMAREDTPGDKRLAAYLILQAGVSMPSVSELRAFLQTQLPEYMAPSSFTMLESFPLTPNGKVDRRALPAPEGARPDLANSFLAPRNDTERVLAGVWQDALKLEQVGIDDNFFELGGHSLLVVQVHQQIQLHFQTDLTIAQMFQYPTIRSLAQYLSHSNGEPAVSQRQSTMDRAARAKAAATRWKNRDS